jgi:hypothetical protein
MANVNGAGQDQCDDMGGIPLWLEKARHEYVGVEHDFHLRRRDRRAVAISASMSAIVSLSVPLAAAALCNTACAWRARTLRKVDSVGSKVDASTGKRTATGWPNLR